MTVGTSSELIRGLRRELGREPRLPTLRRLVGSLGGRLELAVHFERPLEVLAADIMRERDERKALHLADRRRT